MKEKLLEIQDLEVKYFTDEDVVSAVNKISFQIAPGETLGLVGETGAGKTTTALSILKLLPEKVGKITNGKILFEGIDITEAPRHVMQKIRGSEISMIFQDPMTSLNPVLTVEQQIGETILLHNQMPKKEIGNKVDEILKLVGISLERKKDYPHQFSGGMKQRVVIAMALACNPKFLIADEPTTALDVTIQAQVLEMMNDLKKKLNTAMLLITHDLGVVVRMCDNVAIMYAGEIVEYGSVYEVFNKELPHHPYTVGLFQSIPNLAQKTERLFPIEGNLPDPTQLPAGCKFAERCKFRQNNCELLQQTYRSGEHRILCEYVARGGRAE